MAGKRRIAGVLLLFLALSPAVYAEDTGVAAAERLQEGTRLYQRGELEAALAAFTAAYEAEPRPELLFQIGQCHRRLGRRDEAVFFFRGYLARLPDAPDRIEVEGLIVEQQLLASNAPPPVPEGARFSPTGNAPATPAATTATTTTATTATTTTAATAAPGSRTPFYKKWWFWTGTAAVLAAVGTGLGVGLTSGQTSLPSLGDLKTIDARP